MNEWRLIILIDPRLTLVWNLQTRFHVVLHLEAGMLSMIRLDVEKSIYKVEFWEIGIYK